MDTRKVDIIELSKFYIYHSLINGIDMSHLKLQKLLYYTQAYHLVYFEKQNIFDDQPEAWVNGPVYRAVYNSFKHYGVYQPIKVKEGSDEKIEMRYKQLKSSIDLSDEQWKFINSVLNYFGVKSHEELVLSTHRELPWNEARKDIGPFDYSNEKLSFDTMYNFYSKVLDKRNV
jgi:uncharacterized phage-associated protein